MYITNYEFVTMDSCTRNYWRVFERMDVSFTLPVSYVNLYLTPPLDFSFPIT